MQEMELFACKKMIILFCQVLARWGIPIKITLVAPVLIK